MIRDNIECNLIFEYMDCNLYSLIQERAPIPFSDLEASRIMRQILRGLEYVHSCGFIHRDLKPENILIKHDTLETLEVKIGDFGLARMIRDKSPLTSYVSTRWYRAPECLLHSSAYSYPVDMWAVGVIWVELLTLTPLFPGNSEIDQLRRIADVLGPIESWKTGEKLAKNQGFRFPCCMKPALPILDDKIVGSEIVKRCLVWDPDTRITACTASASSCIGVLKCEVSRDSIDSLELEGFLESLDTLASKHESTPSHALSQEPVHDNIGQLKTIESDPCRERSPTEPRKNSAIHRRCFSNYLLPKCMK